MSDPSAHPATRQVPLLSPAVPLRGDGGGGGGGRVCGEVGPATRQEVTVRTAERKGHVVLAEQRKAEDAAWAGLRQWDQSFP